MRATITDGRSGQWPTARLLRLGLVLLILLAAAAFRLVDLPSVPPGTTSIPPGMTGIPPGMTHDEADHGLTAWGILNGARDIYFTVGYGREPLYDYATAPIMAATGPNILAPRLASVYFSLLMIAAVYAWARRAFGGPVALLAAAGLAVGFWPVMAGRQALRSIALPALFALAVLFYWQASTSDRARTATGVRRYVLFVIAGFVLGLTFYTYVPARVMWLAFPSLTLYLLISGRAGLQGYADNPSQMSGSAVTLLVAAAVAAPLFVHLAGNPGLEVRIDELSAPLRTATAGDFGPLWSNASGALKLFTIEGDQTWRYNIPGKPWMGPVMGVLFYVGLVVAGWLSFGTFGKGRNRALQKRLGFYRDRSSPGAFLALVWLALGFAPVLITGPGLSMTQAIGALPVLYLFPALAFVAGYGAIVGRLARRDDRTARFAPGRVRGPWALAYSLLAAAFLVAMATRTARDYFGRWANAPEVRVQYEATMVAALDYLNRQGSGAAAVSTITPGRFHTPAIALLTLRNPEVVPRWFDGRQSLILPGESGATVVIPGFTPLPPLLQPFLAGATLVEELPMRPDDLDRPVRVYSLDGESVAQDLEQSMTTTTPGAPLPVRFGDHLELTGYDLPSIQVKPGGTLSLVTAWRILAPLPGASLFAQILGDGGRPIATADALGAPGEWWVAGDTLLQLHTLELPPGTTPGQYPLIAGAYVRPDGLRLSPAAGANDYFELATVTVADD